VRCLDRALFQRLADHPLHSAIGDGARHPGSLGIHQPVEAIAHKAGAPLAHRLMGNVARCRHMALAKPAAAIGAYVLSDKSRNKYCRSPCKKYSMKY
jgi:hypothetical protein